MNASDSNAPKRSLFRRIFRWRTLAILGFSIVALVTLAVLLNAEENWRASRAWKQCRQALEAKGERLDLAGFVRPLPPADRNFGAAPLLSNMVCRGDLKPPLDIHLNGPTNVPSLGSWRAGLGFDAAGWCAYYRQGANDSAPAQPESAARDILAALGRYDREFAELRAAAALPEARFLWLPTNEVMALNMPFLAGAKSVSQAVCLRANAWLLSGRPEEALAELRINLKLIDALDAEPLLISFLVARSVTETALQPLWEGLRRNAWSEAQLAGVEAALARLNAVERGIRTLRGERAFGNALSGELIRHRSQARQALAAMEDDRAGRDWPWVSRVFFPCWVVWRSQVLGNRCLQDIVESLEESLAQPSRPCLLSPALTNAWNARLAGPSLYNALARALLPVMFTVPDKVCRGQAVVNLARTGVALERYRLANGRYPARLEDLAPRFLEKPLADPYDGCPLRYRLEADGAFTLYSVGTNLADEGGQRPSRSRPRGTGERGDLVWSYDTSR